MTRILYVFFFLFTTSIIYGQDIGTLVAQADSLYRAKNYQAAGETYDLAFIHMEGAPHVIYNAACTWALAGDTDRALNYMERFIATGHANDQYILKDKDLTSLHELTSFKKLIAPLTAKREAQEAQYNQPLKKQLEALRVRDQTLRSLWREIEAKYGQDSPNMAYFHQLLIQEDSINLIEVEQIIATHGWLGKSEVGKNANSALWLIIQHSDLATQEKYLPLLKASVDQNESKGSHYALMQDRILMRQGKKQIYGSQVKRDKDNGTFYLHPIANPRTLNQRRLEIGMPPIEEYISKWGIKWDVEEMAARECCE